MQSFKASTPMGQLNAPHIVHADGKHTLTLESITNLFEAQFTPSGADLLITGGDAAQVLILGYYRNAPHATLSDAAGNVLEGLQLRALTTLFTGALRDAPALGEILHNAVLGEPSQPAALVPALRDGQGLQLAWGALEIIACDALTTPELMSHSAEALTFTVVATPAHAFLLGDDAVLRVGDSFTMGDVKNGLIALQHDETGGEDSLLLLSLCDSATGRYVDDVALEIRIDTVQAAPQREAAPVWQQSNVAPHAAASVVLS